MINTDYEDDTCIFGFRRPHDFFTKRLCCSNCITDGKRDVSVTSLLMTSLEVDDDS